MRTLFALAATASLAACGPGQSSTKLPSPITASRATSQWMATLAPVGASTVRGTANMQMVNGRQMIQLQITGGTPNASHPWHIHTGTCSSGGAIVGAPAGYTALGTGSDGTASISATLATPIGGGGYHVNVHSSPSDLTVVACGDLVLL